jgi:hypothetical protein
MPYLVFAILIGLVLFVAMVAAQVLGRRIGQRRFAEDPATAQEGLGVIDGAVFGLFGLLIAFTFSGAGSRFDERRTLIVEEANAIGTAWLRIDMVPAEQQPALRRLFRDYVDARIATADLLPDIDASNAQDARAMALQSDIWAAATTASLAPGQSAAVPSLLLSALNEMFDITTTRRMAAERHPPMAVWVLFVVLAIVSALLAGIGSARGRQTSLTHLVGFPAVIASVVALVINLEHPRLGLITLRDFDRAISDVRASMD